MGARQSRRSDSPERDRDGGRRDSMINKRNEQQSFARALKITFAVMVSLAVLLLLLALVVMGVNREGEGGGGGPDDEGPSLVFAMVWMLLMAICLLAVGFAAIWSNRSTMTPRFRVGLLAGSVFMYANMAFVCAVSFFTIFPGENGQERYLQEEEGSGSLLFAIACLILGVAYAILAVLILNQAKAMSDEDTSDMEWNDNVDSRDVKSLSMVWTVLCLVSLVGLFIALIAAMVPLFGEDAERAREEGAWGLLASVLYLLILMGLFFRLGVDVFGERRTATQVMIGLFSGGLLFFAGLCLMFAVFNGSFSREEREREGGTGSMIFSIFCFLLMLMHGVFAFFVIYGNQAIIDANAKDRVSRPFFSFA